MDNKGREVFWNVLMGLHDDSEESMNSLRAASAWPKQLCRFRSVTEHSLQQLNENKMFFSSANFYDDPFDTYFYTNVKRFMPFYEMMRKALDDGNVDTINTLRQLATTVGLNPDVFVSGLFNSSLDFPILQGKMADVRSFIQKGLYSICFCEDPYNETLWLKYAANYSGFVQIYDMEDQDTFLCGKEDVCKNCISEKIRPNIYPVYYSDNRYDATKYAFGVLVLDGIRRQPNPALAALDKYIYSALMWEPERISLIKKKCHEYDQEWRMLHPIMSDQRPCIKMKPCKVIIGLRTTDEDSEQIIIAAKNAGIKEIHKLFINDADQLDSQPVPDEQ